MIRKILLRLVFIRSFSLLFLLPANSVRAQTLPDELIFKQFTRSQGLSGLGIKTLCMDRDGFLWVGTQRGLDRFDGTGFRYFPSDSGATPSPQASDITAIWSHPQTGEIWLATEAGGLSRFDRHQSAFMNISLHGDVPDGSIRVLRAISEQSLLAGTESGLWMIDTGSGACKKIPMSANGQATELAAEVNDIAPAGDAKFYWVATQNGLQLLDIRTHTCSTPQRTRQLRGLPVSSVVQSKGILWAGTSDGRLFRITDEAVTSVRLVANEASGKPVSITTLHPSKRFADQLWVGTGEQGLLAVDGSTLKQKVYSEQFNTAGSLKGNDIFSIFESDDGILWLATRLGVHKASLYRLFSAVIAIDLVNNVLPGADSESKVIGLHRSRSDSQHALVSIMDQGVWLYDRAAGTLEPDTRLIMTEKRIISIFDDGQKALWLAGISPVLYRLKDGKLDSVRFHDAQKAVVHQIYSSPSDTSTLWLATQQLGLLEIEKRNGKLRKQYTFEDAQIGRKPVRHVSSIFESDSLPGELWLPTWNHGLIRFNLKSRKPVFYSDLLDCPPATSAISVFTKNGEQIWLGSNGRGLVLMDMLKDSFRIFGEADGLPDTDVSAIHADKQGRLWLSTSSGLALFYPENWNILPFTERDGIPVKQFFYQAHDHYKATDEMLFGGINGFIWINPQNINIDTSASPLKLTAFAVNDVPRTLPAGEKSQPLSLQFWENDIKLDFALLDLRQPEKNRYEARLEGAQDEWIAIGNTSSQHYPALQPGDYVFRVRGVNSHGIWTRDDASLQFQISPPFWRAPWFWTLVAFFVLGGMFWLYRYRVAQLQRIIDTRQAIADDIHDDLGSKIGSVGLLIDGVMKHLPDSATQDRLRLVKVRVRDLVNDLRDAIWMVDAGNDDLAALVERIKSHTREWLTDFPHELDVVKSLPEKDVGMELRRHIFLLYKEMLSNVVRHAQAKSVKLKITFDDTELTIRLHDDGVGFDPTSPSAGRGQRSLRRRADRIKARFEIRSEPEKGTEQILRVKIA